MNGAPSREQVNVEPLIVEVKLKLALELFTVPLGPEVIVVSGAGLAAVLKLQLTAEARWLPARSAIAVVSGALKLCPAARAAAGASVAVWLVLS